jgi:hypothetical protein
LLTEKAGDSLEPPFRTAGLLNLCAFTSLPFHVPNHQPRPLVLRLFLALIVIVNLLLGWTILQQDRTIESQRKLIHTLMHDSMELNAVRNQLIHQAN